MDEIIKQAPMNISKETIEDVYEKNNKDPIKTLMELWEISEVSETKSEKSKVQLKWDEVREICDEFDNEMYNQIRNNKSKVIISNDSK
jgi:hypothetical protein